MNDRDMILEADLTVWTQKYYSEVEIQGLCTQNTPFLLQPYFKEIVQSPQLSSQYTMIQSQDHKRKY